MQTKFLSMHLSVQYCRNFIIATELQRRLSRSVLRNSCFENIRKFPGKAFAMECNFCKDWIKCLDFRNIFGTAFLCSTYEGMLLELFWVPFFSLQLLILINKSGLSRNVLKICSSKTFRKILRETRVTESFLILEKICITDVYLWSQ